MNRLMYGLVTLVVILLFTACDDAYLSTDITPIEATTTTNFKIRMTDAPIDYEEVNIDLQGVIIYGKSKKEVDSIELGTNTGIYNLLDFQNGIDTLIANAMITVDTIKEVRLLLGENNTVKVDGELYDLTIPGNAKNGLRIKLCLPLTSLDEFVLNIDFDAKKSVKKTGNGYKLKPVIKVLNPDVEIEEEEGDDLEEIEEEDINENEEEEENEEANSNDTLALAAAIKDYIDTNFSEFTIKKIDSLILCDGTPTLAVNLQDKQYKIKPFFSDDNYLQQSVSIKKKDIPTDILDVISKEFKGYKPTNPLTKTTLANETVQYELTIRKGNDEKQVIISEDGSPICEV